MSEKLTAEEFEALYYINIGRNSLDRLNDIFEDINKTNLLVKKLEEKGLIKVEIREGAIYGFMETQKGLKTLKSEEYKGWYVGLGH